MQRLELTSLAPRLERHRKDLELLARGKTLVTFFATDGGGITTVGAIAACAQGGDEKVAALLVDVLFEE